MKWVSVKERLPEPDKPVLIYNENKDYHIGMYVNWLIAGKPDYWGWYQEKNDQDSSFGKVTHWMPLPTTPEEMK